MDLFSKSMEPLLNLLPYDGVVQYYGRILTPSQRHLYFNLLLSDISWNNDVAYIFGKKIVTKRKVAWYGDKPYAYTYSNHTKVALPWTPELLYLKQLVEHTSKEHFNSCLLNLYHEGSEGMAWHSDSEKALKKDGAIGSLSLGAERKFAFKHKKNLERVSLNLEDGSLLMMKGSTQTYWLHRLPPTKLLVKPRINLTFRTIMES